MRAGKLRHSVTLQSQSLTADGAGGATESWVDFVTVRANVEPLSGTEAFQAQQVNDDLSHTVTMRYYPGVTSKMRVKYGTRYFLIESIINTGERNREMILACREVVA